MVDDEFLAAAQEDLEKARKGDEAADARFTASIPLLEQIAAAGDGAAHAMLGGHALEFIKDHAAALRHFEAAAAAGNPAGMRGLGTMLAHGTATQLDPKRAFRLFEQAAAMGDAVAAYNLATMCSSSSFKDEARALALLAQASDAGFALANTQLGDLHARDENYIEARRFYEFAAVGGDRFAMRKLAALCRDGIGGPVDRVEAVRWFLSMLNYADANGVHDAIQVARNMTVAEIMEATALSGRPEDGKTLVDLARGRRKP